MLDCKKTIAIIDDCPEDREVYKYFLSKSNIGYKIEEFDCANDAIDYLNGKPVECVLLDYNLPDMNAIDTLKNIDLDKSPVVVLTGNGSEEIAASAFKHGAYDYIVKSSITHDLLVKSINLAIEKHNLKRELNRKNTEILHNSTHDALTGLYNRQFLEDSLAQKLTKSFRRKTQIAVLFIDLDKFKFVNDYMGHNVGDQVLKIFAERMTKVIRNEDMLCRNGGDEFIAVIDDVKNANEVALVAKKIIQETCKEFVIENSKINISASIGIYMYDGTFETTVEQILKYADKALYDVKSHGKNNFEFFSKDLEDQYSRQIYLEGNIANALKNNEFYLVFQPQYNLFTRKIIGAEALLRWKDPFLGEISPTEFIPIAETSGQIYDLGIWVAKQSIESLSDFQHDENFTLSINLSPFLLSNENLLVDFKAIVESHPKFAKQIVIEITESGIIESESAGQVNVNELLNLGFSLAIDDFGIGYSSLYHLSNLSFSALKVDQSFIKGIAQNTKNQNIVNVINTLGKSLGVKIVFEGIENKEDEEVLKNMGCVVGQGFYFSKPCNINRFIEVISEQ